MGRNQSGGASHPHLGLPTTLRVHAHLFGLWLGCVFLPITRRLRIATDLHGPPASFGTWNYYLVTFVEELKGATPLLASAYVAPAGVSGIIAGFTVGFTLPVVGPIRTVSGALALKVRLKHKSSNSTTISFERWLWPQQPSCWPTSSSLRRESIRCTGKTCSSRLR